MARSVHSRRTATMAALAAELGVSRTTVSNAYNRPDQLSPELRKRVLETARRLGYPGPDPVARSLRTRQAGAVGVLLTEALSSAFQDPAAIGFLEGLAMACGDAGRGLLLVPAGPDADERKVTATVHRAAVDGFVVYSVPDDDPHFAAVLQRPLPVVVCDQPQVDGVAHVGIDDRAAMQNLGAHLVGLGHRRIGVVCVRLGRDRHDGFVTVRRQRATRFPVQRARLAGLADAFGAALLDWNAVPVVERFDHTISSGASATSELLDRDSRLTAIVCTSDILALGALHEIRQRGRRVPEDFTVTGFDGVPEAERAGLTTVSQPVLEKGQVAGRLLLDRSRPKNRTIMLPTDLVVRSTSGRAPS
ncbi:MAG: LacI family DNA-binding transcriptional regulator [Pseudonocardiales bacterium]|nr:LacI family DNA-binding transcriptional regulator [Pseudonocardiales bacterium]MBV9729738.1 LacI family DNA-binding transcriptional regulator [Pseudonocardiales bacterium]